MSDQGENNMPIDFEKNFYAYYPLVIKYLSMSGLSHYFFHFNKSIYI